MCHISFVFGAAVLTCSPETVRTYAIRLKLWWEFLRGAGCGFDAATVDQVARFV